MGNFSKNKFWAFFVILFFYSSTTFSQNSNLGRYFLVNPGTVSASSGAEYVTLDPKIQTLISVMILGEVVKTGVYHVPPNTKLAHAVALAGGTNANASGSIKILRNGEEKNIELFGEGLLLNLKAGDTIIAQKSFKTHLPLIFSVLSAALTAVTLFYVIEKGK